MNWIRQDPGKGLEWIGEGFTDTSSNDYADSVKGCIEISKDIINSTVYLRLLSQTQEDFAVYSYTRNTG